MTDFIDTAGTAEIFCEGIARVERIGPNRRLVFAISRYDYQGNKERVAVVNLILPAEASVSVAQMLLNDTPEPLAFASLSLAVVN